MKLAKHLPCAFLLLLLSACADDGKADSQPDGSPELTDGGVDDEGIDWLGIAGETDAVGDCDLEDGECVADIVDLLYAIDDDTINLKLKTTDSFPAGGAFEIFLVPQTTSVPGLTFRLTGENLQFWRADCSSKHEGCHWYNADAPESFEAGWADGRTSFTCALSLSEVGFAELDVLLLGVAASHEAVTATSEFTDRYPDELWVTAQDILGLAEVPLK